jgi:hypothetical protein
LFLFLIVSVSVSVSVFFLNDTIRYTKTLVTKFQQNPHHFEACIVVGAEPSDELNALLLHYNTGVGHDIFRLEGREFWRSKPRHSKRQASFSEIHGIFYVLTDVKEVEQPNE